MNRHAVTLAAFNVSPDNTMHDSMGIGSDGMLWPSYGFGGGSLEDGGGWGGVPYAQNNHAPTNKKKANPNGCQDSWGRPILVSSGTKVETYPIFALPGEMGLSFTLYYNTALKIPQALSNAYWATNLQYTLTATRCFVDKQGDLICHAMTYQRPDGSTIVFTGAPEGGPYTENGGGGLATLTYDDASSTYSLHDEDAMAKVFDVNGELQSITSPSGISWTITRSGSSNGFTYTVTHSSGRSYAITYGTTTNNVTPVTVTDPAGNVYTLQMTGGNFQSITYPGTPATTISFKYPLSALPNLLTEVDYNGAPYDYTAYDTTSTDPHYGWATANYLADNSESVAISYANDAAGNVQATITNALGHQTVQTYDGTNGAGGAYNGQLSQISNDSVATCGATVQGRAYDANGYLSQTVDNNGNAHTYTYAATGQLQNETEASGTMLARTTDYTWDNNRQLNRPLSVTVEGWSKTTSTYNAQNRLASVQVTDLSRGANQTLITTYSYTLYANGMVHTMTVTHPSPGNVDTYTYDALGNLSSVANGLGQTTAYSNYNGLGEAGHVIGPNGDVTDVTYDARGRVHTKTTYPNGTAASWTYGYDGFGLLASELTPAGESTNWSRDAEMRVKSIVRNDKDGASTESFGYDANGDVTSHTVSRNGTTSLSETLSYDALGRVYQRLGMHSQKLTYGYDGNGNVVLVTDAAGHTVSNQYDALNRLTRTTSSGGASPPMPSAAPTLSAPANSSSGSYTVSWGTVSGATSYILQEQVSGGAWVTVQSSAAISWAASGKSNANYGYQVRACNSSGCSPWSSVASVAVLVIPPPPPPASISVPPTSNGPITISWATSATATGYDLYQEINNADWRQVYSGAGTTATLQASVSGNYNYWVAATNASGWSGVFKASGAVIVTLPPTSAPAVSLPATSTNGSYAVSWGAVSAATSYTLQEQINGGGWTTVQNNDSGSWGASGKGNGAYGYHVQGCNAGGCGPWSGTGNVSVLLVPATPTGLSATLYATYDRTMRPPTRYSLAASWPGVPTASSYIFKNCQQSGVCGTTPATTTSIPEFYVGGPTASVMLQACNASGCSAWSAPVTPTMVNQ